MKKVFCNLEARLGIHAQQNLQTKCLVPNGMYDETVHLLGPVVQSIVSFTSSLVVKLLTVLVSTISNSQVFLLKKNVSSFCKCKSYSHFFSKKIIVYVIFNDRSFNDTLNNDIVSFEQLTGP